MNTKLLDKLVKNGNCFDKMNCVDLKYGLDVLVHEEGSVYGNTSQVKDTALISS